MLWVVVGVRCKTDLERARPHPPEKVYHVPRHGQALEAFLEDGGRGELTGTDRYDEFQDRPRSIAVTAVMRSENCTQASAQELVDTGAWTDDSMAASFLAKAKTPGLTARLKATDTGPSCYREAASAAAAEIARTDAEASR